MKPIGINAWVWFHARGNDWGAPGVDHIPWEAVTSALHQTGYDAALLIESFTPDNQTIARAAIWRPLAETRDRPARDGLAFLHGALA
jgi:D-psicose/D-tagatose/L-ribulose 3-epimerase